MSNFARFNATLAKVTVNGKKAQVVLDLNHKAVEEHYLTLVGSIDEEIMISIGNPQMSMEDVGVQIPQHGGLKATVGPGGIVEKVEGGQQAEIGADDILGMQTCQKCSYILDEGATECPNCNERSVMDFEDGAENTWDGVESDVSTSDDQSEPNGDNEAENPPSELEEASVEKEQLEQYILDEKPAFEDIPYDFPTLLERKRNGERWMDISSSLGITSGKLSSAWSEYKKRVKKLVG